MRTRTSCLVVLACLVLSAAGAHAANPTILNFEGFMYEADNGPGAVGFPPSNPGDELAGCGIITGMSAPLTWSSDTHQYTWTVQGLISLGQVDLGDGIFEISYTGGTIDIVADRFLDPAYSPPEYGVDPPNPTAPSSFHDGSLYLHGTFSTFVMYYFTDLHTGQYEGLVTFQLGSNLGDLEDPDGYVFAGTADRSVAIVTPDGYDLEAVGHINFDSAVPVEPSSWGRVKNLYR